MAGIKANLSSIKKDLGYVFKGPSVSGPNIAANNAVDASSWYVRAGEKFGGKEHAMNIRKAKDTRASAKNDYDAATKTMKTNIEESRSTLAGMKEQTGSRADIQRKAIRDQESGLISEKEKLNTALRSGKATRGDMARSAWGLYNGGTAGQRALKYGATAGAYGALAGTGRMLSGGSVTTNANGERDIMGIPFV